MNTLSIQRPRPSMEMRIPESASAPVKAALVNWLPSSVLKISDQPNRAKASSSAETQNATSMLFDSRQPAPLGSPNHHRHEVEKAPPDGAVADVVEIGVA